MNVDKEPKGPVARQEELLVEEVENDLVIYDSRRQEAHRLNRIAAIVWRNCDGSRTVGELGRMVREETGAQNPNSLVDLAIAELEEAALLEEVGTSRGDGVVASSEEGTMSRRRAIRTIGGIGAATALLPLVTTIMAPTPAMANSSSGESGGGGSSSSSGGSSKSGSGYWWCDPTDPKYDKWLAKYLRSMTGC